MIISESSLRKKIRSVLSELLGAKRKESLLQRALGGSMYSDGGYGGGYGDYDDYDYYDDYGYYGGSDDDGDDGDGDDGGED